MFRLTTVFVFGALIAFVNSKILSKREIGRDGHQEAIGPTVAPTEAHLYRYQVAVGTNCGQSCGGTILSDRFILTAAHCINDDPKLLTIKAGITNVDDDKNAQIRDVFAFIKQRNYNLGLNDIALLVLQEPLDMSTLTAAKLPKEGEKFTGQMFEVSGWGSTSHLTYAHFTVVENHKDCAHPSRLCAKAYPEMATIHGDSGGPAIIRRGEDVILIGAVKGKANNYLFTDVAYFRRWIDSAIAEGSRLLRIADRVKSDLPKNSCHENILL